MATKAVVSAANASPLMSLKEASLFLHVGVKTIRRLCATGVLAYRDDLGKGFLVRRSEIEAFSERGWHRALEPEPRSSIGKKRVKREKGGRNRLILKGEERTVDIESNVPAARTEAAS